MSIPRNGVELYGRIGGAVVLAVALSLVLSVSNASSDIVFAFCGMAIVWMLDRSGRYLVGSMFVLLIYASGAYIAARVGITYYPRPPLDVYAAVCREQIEGVLVTGTIGEVFGIGQRFKAAIESDIDVIRRAVKQSSFRFMPLVKVVALVIGLYDWSVIVRVHSALLAVSRHEYQSRIFTSANQYSSFVALLVGYILLAWGSFAEERRARRRALVLFAFMWLPYVISGSRHYLAYLGIAFIIMRLRAIASFGRRTLLVAGSLFVTAAALLVPTLYNAQRGVAFNEWILPTSQYIAVREGIISASGIGASGFWAQAQLLVPHVVRLSPVHLFSAQFQALGVTNVGVGGNPWVDTYVTNPTGRLLTFAAATLGMFVLGVVLSKWLGAGSLVAIGPMVFWGRSVFWDCAFFVIYLAIGLWVLRRSVAGKVMSTKSEGDVQVAAFGELGNPAKLRAVQRRD